MVVRAVTEDPRAQLQGKPWKFERYPLPSLDPIAHNERGAKGIAIDIDISIEQRGERGEGKVRTPPPMRLNGQRGRAPTLCNISYLSRHAQGAPTSESYQIPQIPQIPHTAADACGFYPRISEGPACYIIERHPVRLHCRPRPVSTYHSAFSPLCLARKKKSSVQIQHCPALPSIGYFITHQGALDESDDTFVRYLLRLFPYFSLEFSTTHGGR